MNKYIIGVLVIVALIAVYIFSNSGNQEQTKTAVASEIVVVESSYDFGEIDIFGGKVSTDYIIKNTGQEDVTVKSAFTSRMCTEGEIDNILFGMHDNKKMSVVIPAGGEKVLTATYDPLAHGPSGTGKITRELTIKTNSSITPELVVKFSADVVKNEE